MYSTSGGIINPLQVRFLPSNKEEKSDVIYNYIYDNVVDYCVEQIENGNYEEAYSRYKSSVLTFEEQFARPILHNRLVKSLTLQTSN